MFAKKKRGRGKKMKGKHMQWLSLYPIWRSSVQLKSVVHTLSDWLSFRLMYANSFFAKVEVPEENKEGLKPSRAELSWASHFRDSKGTNELVTRLWLKLNCEQEEKVLKSGRIKRDKREKLTSDKCFTCLESCSSFFKTCCKRQKNRLRKERKKVVFLCNVADLISFSRSVTWLSGAFGLPN